MNISYRGSRKASPTCCIAGDVRSSGGCYTLNSRGRRIPVSEKGDALPRIPARCKGRGL